MDTNWQSNSTSKQEIKPRAEFQAAIMKLWESVRRSGQLIQTLNLDNENLTAKISEMEQHLRDRSGMLMELEARQASLENELSAYELLQNNYQMAQENVSEAFLKIQHLERENTDLRRQVENFGELEKSLSLLQKEIVRRNAEMNARINESFKQKAQIAELESKIFEMNGLRGELEELRGIIGQFEQNGSFQNSADADGNFVVSYDADMAAVIDAVRQEEEKLRDEYEIIMVRQQEALDTYAENLLKAQRENEEKDEILKDLQQRVGDYEEAYISQKDVIAGLQMEVDLFKEQSDAENDAQAMTIMIQEISEQKQRAESERNELAEELMKTRQMFALAQQQIKDLEKIEDEYEQMRKAHDELGRRVDEMQNSQKKSYDFQEVVTSLQEKVAELQGRFKEDGEVKSPAKFLKDNGVNNPPETKIPADVPFKKTEIDEPQARPEIIETEDPQPEITETEPERPLKRQPETKPRKVSKEKTAANPAKDVMVNRMAALLERLEKSIQ